MQPGVPPPPSASMGVEGVGSASRAFKLEAVEKRVAKKSID